MENKLYMVQDDTERIMTKEEIEKFEYSLSQYEREQLEKVHKEIDNMK